MVFEHAFCSIFRNKEFKVSTKKFRIQIFDSKIIITDEMAEKWSILQVFSDNGHENQIYVMLWRHKLQIFHYRVHRVGSYEGV